jgi:Tfp pilus assembly protein PilN
MLRQKKYTIEITADHTVMLYECTRKGKLSSLAMHASQQLGSVSDARFLTCMESWCSLFDLCEQEIHVIVPSSACLLRVIDLPAGVEDEVRKMIGMQLSNMLPYETHEISFDYVTLSKSQGDGLRVAVFLMTEHMLHQYIKPLRSVGIVPQSIMPPVALMAHVLALVSNTKDPVMLVHCDASVAECVVMDQGDLVFMHSTSMSQEYALTPEKAVRALCGKFKETVAGCEPVHVWVTTQDMFMVVQQTMEVQFPRAVTTGIMYDSYLKADVSISESVQLHALALTSGRMIAPVSILPEELKVKKQGDLSRRSLWVMGGALVFALCCFIVWIVMSYVLHASYLDTLKNEYALIKQQTVTVRNTLRTLDHVQGIDDTRSVPLAVLAELYETVPSNLFLTYFHYADDEGLKVRGIAKQLSEVTDLVLALQETTLFQDVEMKFAKQRQEGTQSYIDFQIDGFLAQGGAV